MIDDTELLRRYADEGSEEAFTELVQRHLNLVYSAALRQVHGDTHLAADACQLVFTDVARKAGALAGHRVLAGWLFTSARYAARNLVRGERRRQAREQEALNMENLNEGEAAPVLDWQRVRPVLDEVINELGRTDREAVLLRFFEGRDYASVGAKLNLSPNTARMRVERALDRLRGLLERRGVESTSAALAAALAGQAVAAAPAGLAAAVAGAALTGASATGVLATIFMSVTKLQMGAAAALIVAGVGGYLVQAEMMSDTRAEIAARQQQHLVMAQWRAENERLARSAAEAADLRRDDAQLAQLRDDATALQAKWRATAAAERAKAAAALPPLTGPIVDAAKLDIQPRPRIQARPEYPAALRKAGIGGSVVVGFVIAADGAVRNATAVRSSGGKVESGDFVVQGEGGASDPKSVQANLAELEAAAVNAVEKWLYAPGEKSGQKVNVRVQVPIVFTLSDGAKGPAPTLWF